MRSYSFIFLFLLISLNTLAQNVPAKGKISGTVIDASTKLAVDYATITVYKAGTKIPVNGSTSDPKGNFSVNGLTAGDYRVTVDFIGYTQKVFDKVSIGNNSNISMGTILLASTEAQLQGITITAKTPVIENKIDKMVYNTANDLTAQGGVATDVLRKVPMVSVDIDGNVELQGSSAIRFLINGKPSSIFGASLADALQSIPASQIKSVEVITSPGAKYDANGTGGIINIVLKDNKFQGINGSINGSAGTRLENGSLSVNGRKGNFGIGISLSGNTQLNTVNKSSSSRQSVNPFTNTTSNFLQEGTSPMKRGSYQTGLNLSWSISPKDELSAGLSYHHFNNESSGSTFQDQQYISSAGLLLSDLMNNRNSTSNLDAHSTDLDLAYKKSFKKEGHELEFTYNSSFGRNTLNASQVSTYLNGAGPATGIRSVNPGQENQTEAAVNYTLPLSEKLTFEAGGKFVRENLNNLVSTDTLLSNGTYMNNSNQSYGFNYKRDIYAAYASASFSLFKNFISGKAGLRYERTARVADFSGTTIPGYNTYAPSFTLQHKMGDSQSVKLAYTYRIERPDYGDLNPFYNISDPHNISTGNPLLRPEIGNNFELSYNKNFTGGANISTALYYRRNTDDIQGITTYYEILNVNGTDYPSVSLSQRFNLGAQTGIGANLFASVPVTDQLNLRSNIQIGQRTNSSPGLSTVRAFAYRINLNASYQFSNNLLAEAFGNYNSSQKNILSTRPSSFNYSLAIRKQFWNKNASIGLTAANPFNRYISQKQTSFGSNFTQNNLRLIPVQSFGISLSYKFGKLQFKKDKEDNTPQQPDLGGGK